MKDLHLKYPEEHLNYAKWLAYDYTMNNEPHKYRSCSADIVWNDLKDNEKDLWLHNAKVGFFVYLQLQQLLYLKEFAKIWECPICHYISEDEPSNHHICYECKTHFDYEDSAYTVKEKKERHKELRIEYLENSYLLKK